MVSALSSLRLFMHLICVLLSIWLDVMRMSRIIPMPVLSTAHVGCQQYCEPLRICVWKS